MFLHAITATSTVSITGQGFGIGSSELRGLSTYVTDNSFGAWRSLVAHLPWEQGVGRSNRLAPILRQ